MSTEPITLADIDQLTRAYAGAHDTLTERVRSLETEIDDLKRRRLAGIRSAAAKTADARAALSAAIEAAPELFERPRTLTIYGVKVGLQKGKGELRFASQEQVIRLIRRHLADQEDQLIAVRESVVKTALAKLSASELRKIGCEIVETGDQVVIRSTASDIDKFVDALLAESAEPAAE